MSENSGLLVGAAILLLLGVGAFLWWRHRQAQTPTPERVTAREIRQTVSAPPVSGARSFRNVLPTAPAEGLR